METVLTIIVAVVVIGFIAFCILKSGNHDRRGDV